MKKYCLTNCAKRKFSAIGNFFVNAIIGILVGILIALGLVTVVGLVGGIIQLVALTGFDIWLFHHNTFELGVKAIFGTSLLTFIIYYMVYFIIWLYKMLFYVGKNITMNIIAPEQAECRLFEECKD